ncbi:YciI family protein [Bibersteinia trehalosi]|uniref:YciI family protein n=1 Tax=Bibersteinia trehalosi TaxID=47735 RepID=UPI0007DAA3CB|nr:YciI family protein [Bibersteinia trehalosi]
MYIINIALKMDKISAEQAEQMFNAHRAWFSQYFEQGNFLMLGPYLDQDHAGVIIAQTENREALDTILAEDVYFPDLADYEVREFKDAMSKLA